MEEPQDYRGVLIKLRVHIHQNLEFPTTELPVPGDKIYQATAVTDASQAWFYWCIYTELPEGMPLAEQMSEEGTFVGYFLKDSIYQDGKGTRTKIPILIGRMVYHEPILPTKNKDEWMWAAVLGMVMLAGGAAVGLGAAARTRHADRATRPSHPAPPE